ncbi:MAG: hypothetical protein E6R06_19690 [Mycobacterium sp.]|nr:MAG: hypothetical protein E6R06_19690 [Mycobacterium sp.]
MNASTIPASWLNENRDDVLKAIENGVTAAVIDYITCSRTTFDEAVAEGTERAVTGYAGTAVSFDEAIARGTKDMLWDCDDFTRRVTAAVDYGTAKAITEMVETGRLKIKGGAA